MGGAGGGVREVAGGVHEDVRREGGVFTRVEAQVAAVEVLVVDTNNQAKVLAASSIQLARLGEINRDPAEGRVGLQQVARDRLRVHHGGI